MAFAQQSLDLSKLKNFRHLMNSSKTSMVAGLYKIERKGVERVVDNMRFLITEEEYAISQSDSLIEEGKVLVDTRHRKISFENEETIWNACFVWDELRLENKEMEITYRLRKN